jgi:hypothetical protein
MRSIVSSHSDSRSNGCVGIPGIWTAALPSIVINLELRSARQG